MWWLKKSSVDFYYRKVFTFAFLTGFGTHADSRILPAAMAKLVDALL